MSEKSPKETPPAGVDLPAPRRGAFPTPRSEIANAVPYVPESGRTDDQPDVESLPPAGDDQKDSEAAGRGNSADDNPH